MAIDNPFEQLQPTQKVETRQLFEKVFSIIPVVGKAMAITKAISEFVQGPDDRLKLLITVMNRESNRFQTELEKQGGKVDELEKRILDPGFREAIAVGVLQSLFTVEKRKIEKFGAVLGYQLVMGSGDQKSWDDAAGYIRDLTQLGEEDIKALQILHEIHGDLWHRLRMRVGEEEWRNYPTMGSYDPNFFTEKHTQVLELLEKLNIPRDDFYARCHRLQGFGLVIEVQRNDGRVAPGDYCFRLTSRGMELINMIKHLGN